RFTTHTGTVGTRRAFTCAAVVVSPASRSRAARASRSRVNAFGGTAASVASAFSRLVIRPAPRNHARPCGPGAPLRDLWDRRQRDGGRSPRTASSLASAGGFGAVGGVGS